MLLSLRVEMAQVSAEEKLFGILFHSLSCPMLAQVSFGSTSVPTKRTENVKQAEALKIFSRIFYAQLGVFFVSSFFIPLLANGPEIWSINIFVEAEAGPASNLYREKLCTQHKNAWMKSWEIVCMRGRKVYGDDEKWMSNWVIQFNWVVKGSIFSELILYHHPFFIPFTLASPSSLVNVLIECGNIEFFSQFPTERKKRERKWRKWKITIEWISEKCWRRFLNFNPSYKCLNTALFSSSLFIRTLHTTSQPFVVVVAQWCREGKISRWKMSSRNFIQFSISLTRHILFLCLEKVFFLWNK